MPKSKYDFLRYDIGGSAQGQTRDRYINLVNELAASVGIATENERLSIFTSGLSAEVQIVPCWFREQEIDGGLKATTALGFNLFSDLNNELELQAQFDLRRVQNNNIVVDSELKANVTLLGIISHVLSVVAELDSVANFAFNKPKKTIYTASLLALLEIISTQIKQLNLDLTIPAGGTLVIDCENYTAYLDGVNVYKYYSGDWLELSRDTISVTVDSGTGGDLAGTLLYVERYL